MYIVFRLAIDEPYKMPFLYDSACHAAGYDSFRGTQEKAVAAAFTGMTRPVAFEFIDSPHPSLLGPG